MSDSIIQIKEVNKWYGDFQVLKDINLEVKAKEKFILSIKRTVPYPPRAQIIALISLSSNIVCKSFVRLLSFAENW